jgi:putative endonuclease
VNEAPHLKTGAEGELAALDFLQKKGYHILQTNYKCRMGEIDIIALDGKVIVFVEVKTRGSKGFGWPEEAVNKAKQKKITLTAEEFLAEKDLHDEIRFDIISILNYPAGKRIEHFKDAF